MGKRLFVILLAILIFTNYILAQSTGSFTDSRDGHIYKTVKIGNQTWMAENLAYLPAVNRVSESGFEESCFYVYGYSGVNLAEALKSPYFQKYGALYNWKAANESCPVGWHLPTDQEWKEMEKFLGMTITDYNRGWISSGETGKKLKSASGWQVNNGTDEAGFSILPAGCRGYEGFQSMGFCGYFWTASPSGSDNGWRRGFCSDDNGSCREEDRKYFGISVRCLKDLQKQ
jgi:uncharacterized protein (TIGR02145 family)